MRVALDSRLRGVLQILYGPDEVAPLRKMHCQFGRDLVSTWTERHLQSRPNLLMPAHAPAHWHLLVDQFLIQGMAEPVASGDCPIRPYRSPAGLHQLVLAGPGGPLHLDVFPDMLDARRHCSAGELH